MKLVVLSIPNCVSDSEIKEGLTNFAIQLDIASIKVNILEEKDIKTEKPCHSQTAFDGRLPVFILSSNQTEGI